MTGPTKQQIEEAGECARLGLKPGPTAKALRIPARTYYDWRKRGEENRGKKKDPYWLFLESLESGESLAIKSALVTVHRASREGDWKAAAWFLERVGDYTPTSRQEVTVESKVDPRELVLSAVKILQGD
jgi:hypothetical protein